MPRGINIRIEKKWPIPYRISAACVAVIFAEVPVVDAGKVFAHLVRRSVKEWKS